MQHDYSRNRHGNINSQMVNVKLNGEGYDFKIESVNAN